VKLNPPFRAATKADAPALAEFVNMAGEGLAFYLWSRMAEPGEDPWAVGRRRAEREQGSFSYKNAIMLEEGGEAVACLIGYALPDEPVPIEASMPKMFVPLQELENLAPSTWYVNVVAVYPEYRGRGFGAKLLALAEKIAAADGLRGLSIIVNDGNEGAVRLYKRTGYQLIDSRPIVKEDWENRGENMLLLVKAL
jgi:ribosomal protein S18 acetylase RimI-like enzyme